MKKMIILKPSIAVKSVVFSTNFIFFKFSERKRLAKMPGDSLSDNQDLCYICGFKQY